MHTSELERASAEWSALTFGRYQPGARLGRYELLVPVGFGGMAAVWIARLRGDAGFSKLVAIKVMLPHLAAIDEVRRMLNDEARIAARLHHPNVVAIQELDEDRGIPFVVMEWVDGLSLDHLLQPGKGLDPRFAARIVADACAGLHAAHELVDDTGQPLCVVHRDVSPFNLILSLDGAVRVADFGIAKARGQTHLSGSGTIRGRIAYMAPEQLAAQPVDRRTDVFALGAMLHEILTGELAFSGENDAQVIANITLRRYAPPDTPDEVRGLFAVAKCALSHTPADRFQTAEAMRLALDEWLCQNAPPIVTSASIGSLVRERVGAELERRQARLRKALSIEVDPVPLPPPSPAPHRDTHSALQPPTDLGAHAVLLGSETQASAPVLPSVALPSRPPTRRAAIAIAALALSITAAWTVQRMTAAVPRTASIAAAPGTGRVGAPPASVSAWSPGQTSSFAAAAPLSSLSGSVSDGRRTTTDEMAPPAPTLPPQVRPEALLNPLNDDPAAIPPAERAQTAAPPGSPVGPKRSSPRSSDNKRLDEIPNNPYRQ